MIPFDAMWLRLNQLIKPNGAIVLFGSEPFSSMLRVSNLKNYKYDWVWDKVNRPTGHLNAKKQPMRQVEDVVVFYSAQSTYNPQKTQGSRYRATGSKISDNYGKQVRSTTICDDGMRYPRNLLSIPADERGTVGRIHPTQKPVALMEYLIKTYTNEGELVLDFTMGSGTTCVAAYNTSRKCIGIEMDDKYFEVAKQRVSDAINTKASQLF